MGIGNLTFNMSLPGLDHRCSSSNSIGQVDSPALPLNPSLKDCFTMWSEYLFPCGSGKQIVCVSPTKNKTLKVAVTICRTRIPRKNGFAALNPYGWSESQ